MTVAPICLFTYNRPSHTRSTIEQLQKNELAKQSELFIFSDGPKESKNVEKVSEVRQYLKTVDGFAQVTIVEQTQNLGLANSIINGVTDIVDRYGSVIVLEDDMITSPYFLTYMNEALDKFVNEDRVISIHGYTYPVTKPLPEAFFIQGADCWGWATWRRGWEIFNSDGQFLLYELKRRNLVNDFDFNGAYPFYKMLEDQIKGKNNSWAIRWNASAFLAGKLTLYPGRSLIQNIGQDNSGTHSGESTNFDSQLSKTPINIDNIIIEPSYQGKLAFEGFFKQGSTTLLKRLVCKARALLHGKLK